MIKASDYANKQKSFTDKTIFKKERIVDRYQIKFDFGLLFFKISIFLLL